MALKGKKILITCGPTWVAIDSMRVISNRSTGEMGHLLAKALNALKAKVTLLEGPVTHSFKPGGVKVLKFCFFDELSALLNKELKNGYDCVIHAAAVSDFKPENTSNKKIKSDSRFSLKLVPLPKLIGKIKAAAPDVFLVGFKLENFLNNASALRETKALFSKAKCDLVVANFIKSGGYEGLLLDADKTLLGKAKNKTELVRLLVQNLRNNL
ncbi:MAG: phosphopantothenoylcysteine decarboxylase [Candidatus Omnitrophica bacterium]|nr:phosphopantothenoylcysteine decarboxylase [Candidatus Omnitrophota bacterium]